MPDRIATRNLALIVAAVFAFALFIWPGQWRYQTIQQTPMRTHRITGRSQLFFGGEWISLDEKKPSSTDTTRMLNSLEQLGVKGRGGLSDVGYFNGSLYNGTNCTITRVVYEITTRTGQDTSIRKFSHEEYLPSRQTHDVIFQADVNDPSRRFLSWDIDSVEATCPKASR